RIVDVHEPRRSHAIGPDCPDLCRTDLWLGHRLPGGRHCRFGTQLRMDATALDSAELGSAAVSLSALTRSALPRHATPTVRIGRADPLCALSGARTNSADGAKFADCNNRIGRHRVEGA